ncbi:MAG: hypothetical protein R3F17_07975 [Planctomycetota bacterium]
MLRPSLPLLASLLLLSSLAPAEKMVVDRTNNRLVLLSDWDGTLIDANFVDLSIGASVAPIEAVQAPNGDLFVSDQLTDTVLHYGPDGTVPWECAGGHEQREGHRDRLRIHLGDAVRWSGGAQWPQPREVGHELEPSRQLHRPG